MSLKTQERRKYEKCWNHDAYRNMAPGEVLVQDVLSNINKSEKIIDFGTGTGRGAKIIHDNGNPVVMIDLADNCLDPEVKKALDPNFRFLEECLWDELHVEGDYAYCTDVLEHIPPEKVDDVLKNIVKACPKGYLNISTIQDHFGTVLGEALHLTVEPWDWWAHKVQEFATVEKLRINPTSVSIWFNKKED